MTSKVEVIGASQQRNEKLAGILREKLQYEIRHEELSSELIQARHRIVELQSMYGQIHNQEVPVLGLPDEITCMIFDYTMALSLLCHGLPDDIGLRLPMEVMISHVCHQWRSIALSHSRLWSSFSYNIISSLPVPLERFHAYLQRSGPMGLELWFDFRGALGDFEDLLVLLQSALKCMDRWRRFTLLSDLETPVLRVLKTLEESTATAPLLEHFAFCPTKSHTISGFGGSVDAVEGKIFLGGAPNLKSVLMDLTAAIACLPPLTNVTTLRIEETDNFTDVQMSWPLFCDILCSPSLVNLSVVGEIFHPPVDYDNLARVSMIGMKHLRIASNTSFILLLPHIWAPLLESMSIKDTLFPDTFGVRTLTSTTSSDDSSHFPSLESLCFVNVSAYVGHSARTFARMTAEVTELTFSNGDYDESFFTAITTRLDVDEFNTFWPKLRTLTFNVDCNELDGIMYFSRSRPARTIVLFLLDDTIEVWNDGDLDTDTSYEQLANVFNIVTLDAKRNWLRQVKWPPASGGYDRGSLDSLEDPFSIGEYEEVH